MNSSEILVRILKIHRLNPKFKILYGRYGVTGYEKGITGWNIVFHNRRLYRSRRTRVEDHAREILEQQVY